MINGNEIGVKNNNRIFVFILVDYDNANEDNGSTAATIFTLKSHERAFELSSGFNAKNKRRINRNSLSPLFLCGFEFGN